MSGVTAFSEPVIGFRRWPVSDDGQLRPISAVYGNIAIGGRGARWAHGVTRFECLCSPFLRDHEAPVVDGKCGLYAYKVPVPPCGCDNPTHPRHGAVGGVQMWGRGMEHDAGWRWQYAQPVAVVDFTSRLDPAYQAARYPDLATMYGEWAPDVAGDWPEAPVWCGVGALFGGWVPTVMPPRPVMGPAAAYVFTQPPLAAAVSYMAKRYSQVVRQFAAAVEGALNPALRQVTEGGGQFAAAGVLSDSPPTDPRGRALWLRRHRDTGPGAPTRRPPRHLDGRR